MALRLKRMEVDGRVSARRCESAAYPPCTCDQLLQKNCGRSAEAYSSGTWTTRSNANAEVMHPLRLSPRGVKVHSDAIETLRYKSCTPYFSAAASHDTSAGAYCRAYTHPDPTVELDSPPGRHHPTASCRPSQLRAVRTGGHRRGHVTPAPELPVRGVSASAGT